MCEHQGIVVHIDDPALWSHPLGDLMSVIHRGQADGYRKLRVVSIRVKLGILSSL